MEYQFKLSDIAGIYSPDAAQVQALLAVAERLERIADLMAKANEDRDYQTVKLIQALGNAAIHLKPLV